MKGKRTKRTVADRISQALAWVVVISPLVLLVICLVLGLRLNQVDTKVSSLASQLETLRREHDELQILVTHQHDAWLEAQASQVPPPESDGLPREPHAPGSNVTWDMLYPPTDEEFEILAKIVYQEARGVEDRAQQAAVIWCILNRVDANNPDWGDTIKSVATYPNAFAWIPNTPVEQDFLHLAADVCERWNLEKAGADEVGRTLPATYLYFTGDGTYNHFTEEWKGTDYWDWSLPSPY